MLQNIKFHSINLTGIGRRPLLDENLLDELLGLAKANASLSFNNS